MKASTTNKGSNAMNEETCKTCIYFEPWMGICKVDEDFVTGNDFCSNYEGEEEE